MGGSLLAAASAGDCRNVKGPSPALRPGRLRGAFRFRELVPCFGPRPAAFNSLRSCSFSPRRRSISLSACSNCSRKPRFSASYSFSCLRRSSCLEPSIAPYRDTKPPKCPAFPLINYLQDDGAVTVLAASGERNVNLLIHPARNRPCSPLSVGRTGLAAGRLGLGLGFPLGKRRGTSLVGP